MFPCHIVFGSSSCLLCNIMFKSSSVEGHQLKNWLRPRPQYTKVYLILTLSFLSIKNTMLQVKLCSNEIM